MTTDLSTRGIGPVALAKVTLETLASGSRFRARTGKGFDLAFDTGPGALAADPVEHVIAALATCHAMDVISILRKKRLEVTGYEISIAGQRAAEHPRRFTAIEMTHRLRGRGVPREAVEEAVRLSEEKYCTVHHSMRTDIAYTTRIEIVEEQG